ncbi:hypothetical protein [Paenibacillus sp. NPDC057934]
MNLWIGQEYFEFVRIKAKDGGGWVQKWTGPFEKVRKLGNSGQPCYNGL